MECTAARPIVLKSRPVAASTMSVFALSFQPGISNAFTLFTLFTLFHARSASNSFKFDKNERRQAMIETISGGPADFLKSKRIRRASRVEEGKKGKEGKS